MNHASDTLTLHNGVEMPLLGLGVMHMYGSECVRAIGVSNMNIGRLEEVIAAPEIKPAVLQVELHPFFQQKALKERVASCGTGSSNEAHIAENFEIFDFELTDAEMQRIAAMDQNRRHTSY